MQPWPNPGRQSKASAPGVSQRSTSPEPRHRHLGARLQDRLRWRERRGTCGTAILSGLDGTVAGPNKKVILQEMWPAHRFRLCVCVSTCFSPQLPGAL
eukprot:14262140-Alexandrium_andersonii.AAC.1